MTFKTLDEEGIEKEVALVSDVQKQDVINLMTEAAVRAYCEARGISLETFNGIDGLHIYLVKRQAKAMATELDKIVMTNIGPRLICFWSHQGCPELPPLQE